VQTSEWLLTAAVILVPLLIAVTVTLWSLEQARYRPKRKRPPGIRREPVDVAATAEKREPNGAAGETMLGDSGR
jgi:hypothetical protein